MNMFFLLFKKELFTPILIGLQPTSFSRLAES